MSVCVFVSSNWENEWHSPTLALALVCVFAVNDFAPVAAVLVIRWCNMIARMNRICFCVCYSLFVVHTHMHTKLPDHLSVNWKQWAENFKLKIIYATARIWHVRYSKQIHICSYVLVHFSQTVIRLFSRSPSIVCFSMNERMWEFWISFTILLFLLVFFPSLSFAVFDLPHVPLRLWLCLALSQYVVVTSKIY